MHPLRIFLIAFLVTLPLTVLAAPTEVQQLLTEGQTAFTRGDLAAAKSSFEMVYRIDPRNQLAIGYLLRIKAAEASKPKGIDQEKQLATLILPKVELKEATLGSALDFLKKAVDKQSEGKLAVNFVVQLPDDQVKTQAVTLSLSNVPFPEVLRYLGGVAGLNFVYDKYAIIVKPQAATPPAPATTAQ